MEIPAVLPVSGQDSRTHILHIEIGLVYAGSTSVLQNHLVYSDDSAWRHTIVFRSAQAREEFLRNSPDGGYRNVQVADVLESDVLGGNDAGRAGSPLYGGIRPAREERRASRLRIMAGLAKYYLRTVLPEARSWARWMKGKGFDLVQLHNGPLGNVQAILGAQSLGIPVTARFQSFMEPSPLDRRFLGRPLGYLAVADAIKAYYEERGVPRGLIRTVHEGLSEEEFTRAAGWETVKPELGVDPSDFLIGLVGRLVWWKGHDYFVEAAAEVCPKYGNVQFVIVGGPDPTEPQYEQELREKARDLGIGNRVIFTGYRTDARRFSAALDVAVLASCLPEPGGRSILEALAMGRPCIVTDAGGMPEYVGRDARAGLLVPIRDSHALAQAIERLITDRELAARLGSGAHRRMYEHFHMRVTVEGHERFWRDMLAQANASRR